jgi:hypothetical protein
LEVPRLLARPVIAACIAIALLSACWPHASPTLNDIATIDPPAPGQAKDVIDQAKVIPDPAGPDGFTDAQRSALQGMVAQCVQQVRSSAPRTRGPEFWTSFEAYYNPNLGGVVSNATIRGRIDAKFAFDKCMADHGYYPKQ